MSKNIVFKIFKKKKKKNIFTEIQFSFVSVDDKLFISVLQNSNIEIYLRNEENNFNIIATLIGDLTVKNLKVLYCKLFLTPLNILSINGSRCLFVLYNDFSIRLWDLEKFNCFSSFNLDSKIDLTKIIKISSLTHSNDRFVYFLSKIKSGATKIIYS